MEVWKGCLKQQTSARLHKYVKLSKKSISVWPIRKKMEVEKDSNHELGEWKNQNAAESTR